MHDLLLCDRRCKFAAVKKYKALALCDNPLNTSGVGCQAKHLFDRLVATGRWSFRVFGGAIKHQDYSTQVVNEDFIVKPVDGFGTPEMLRNVLMQERPDVLFLFTDPRFFLWVFEMEEEVHQICPIAYWHVWDNTPYPKFNDVLYQSTDLINCHSYLTYEMVHEHFPEKTNFVPHAVPRDMFFTVDDPETVRKHRVDLLGEERVDHFVCIWVNRNARRKMPGNLLYAWKLFLDDLEEREGHRKATLLMHTAPRDPEGQNLEVIADHLGIAENVVYSVARVSFEEMNLLYAVSDCAISTSSHEGFGLCTLEAMMCAKPIIAPKTGGLTRQVVDHRDGSENGVAIDIEVRDLVGGQTVPYIWEDHVSPETVAKSIMKLYGQGSDVVKNLGQKARAYAHSEFDIDRTVQQWDETMSNLIDRWQADRSSVYKPWEVIEL